MNERRRWDTDTRLAGVRDASEARDAVASLLGTLGRDEWVAEEPEVHLQPHLEAAAAAYGVTLRRIADVDGALEVDIDAADRPRLEQRSVVFALIGAIAESSTHVREVDDTFEVVTGMLPGDGDFASHGHLVRIRIAGPNGDPGEA